MARGYGDLALKSAE